MTTNVHLWSYLAQFFLEWKMFQTQIENQNNHFMLNNFFLIWCFFYEVIWKNIVKPDRLQMTTRRLRVACWISKATNTHSEYVILISFPLQQWLQNSPQCCVLRTVLGSCIHLRPYGRNSFCPYGRKFSELQYYIHADIDFLGSWLCKVCQWWPLTSGIFQNFCY